jgi:hypothetical protein
MGLVVGLALSLPLWAAIIFVLMTWPWLIPWLLIGAIILAAWGFLDSLLNLVCDYLEMD